MATGLFGHFHPDERPFVERTLDWIERAVEQHAVKLTDFLDPRGQFIVQTLVSRESALRFRMDGGYAGAERRRVLIAPDYVDLDEEDMRISALAVTSDDPKVSQLEHGDYLGSILGLGVKRDKFGDIGVTNDGCQFVVAAEIADFIRLQLNQVGRVKVSVSSLDLADLEAKSIALEEVTLSVASLRLDGIASDAYKLSRAKILPPIKAGRCRVNFKVEEDPSTPLREGDLVSLQGFGRFKVLEVEGITKSGRVRVRIGKYR